MLITAALLEPPEGLRHGFFTREGGVSEGIYGSLNCGPGSDDLAANVTQNRVYAMAELGTTPDRLCTLYQVHGAEVVTLTEPFAPDARPKADGMVTAVSGIALGILTADCCPVLLADPDAGVIGACHAGWKGALGGIIGATVNAMEALGASPKRMRVALGPAIAQASYEVDQGFADRFLSEDADNARYFQPSDRDGHHRFDLQGYCAARVRASGVAEPEVLAHDTYAEENRFFSYRRATHRGEADYGRQLSAIMRID